MFMTLLKTIIFIFTISFQVAWAESYIDQKDPFFIANKIIPAADSSSLCGPVSFINWLILEDKVRADDARELIKTLNLEKAGGINHGHTGSDLITLIGRAENQIQDQNSYESKSYSQISLDDLNNNKTQLLLLKFKSLPKTNNRYGQPIPFDEINGENARREFLHFVLKIPAADGKFELIDPEQPQNRIFISANEVGGKLLLSNEHYKYFKYTGFVEAHEVQIIEVISRRD